MNLDLLSRFRDSLISQKSLEQRHDALSYIKAFRTGASTLSLLGFAFFVINLHEYRILNAITYLPLAYTGHEAVMLADNIREILENPVKELKAACAKSHSDKEFIRFITQDAPLTRAIGLRYLELTAKQNETIQPRSFFSSIWRRN